MAETAGIVVPLNAARRAILDDCVDEGLPFAEPVPEFVHARAAALVAFVTDQRGAVTCLGQARRGIRAGSGLRRLNITGVVRLPTTLPRSRLVRQVDKRIRRYVDDYLRYGGVLPPKSFRSLVDAVLELAPPTRPILGRFGSDRMAAIARLGTERRRALAYQKEAVLTALSAAGIDKSVVQSWSPASGAESPSFLDGLPQVRRREDAMVVEDLNRLPGFEFLRSQAGPSAVFENDEARLTVVMTNHLSLERQFGIDLVYYNETFKSFVMVQYKAMERDDDGPVLRLPDKQLATEIARMGKTLTALGGCDPAEHRDSFRLMENPFFFKLCPRITFDPDAAGMVSGMYIPLGYWHLLDRDPVIRGPRGGKQVRYSNVGRHFSNTEFVQLLARAWIGTTHAQSELLVPIVRDIVAEGRTVALAVKTDKRRRPAPPVATHTTLSPLTGTTTADKIHVTSSRR